MNLKRFTWRPPARSEVWRRAALWIPRWGARRNLSAPERVSSASTIATSAVAPRGCPRLPEFLAGDPILGIGVLAVIAYHAAFHALYWSDALELPGSFVPLGSFIGPLIETGGFSLALFFALSGYLIGRPFVFALIHGEPLPRLSTYERTRILRIVPVLWAVFTCTLDRLRD